MAKKCEVCGKGLQFGHKVSHSNHKTNRSWHPNLLKIKTNIGGTVKRINICSRCERSDKVVKVI
ncbi:MAG: 50S ribosomal protein L28 [bacterium]